MMKVHGQTANRVSLGVASTSYPDLLSLSPPLLAFREETSAVVVQADDKPMRAKVRYLI